MRAAAVAAAVQLATSLTVSSKPVMEGWCEGGKEKGGREEEEVPEMASWSSPVIPETVSRSLVVLACSWSEGTQENCFLWRRGGACDGGNAVCPAAEESVETMRGISGYIAFLSSSVNWEWDWEDSEETGSVLTPVPGSCWFLGLDDWLECVVSLPPTLFWGGGEMGESSLLSPKSVPGCLIICGCTTRNLTCFSTACLHTQTQNTFRIMGAYTYVFSSRY